MKAKRFFVILLTLFMILAMVPSQAFAANNVLIRTGMRPPEGGNTTDSMYYSYGSVVSLLATPKPGYYFEYWFDYQDGIDFVTTDNPYVFRAETNRTIVASFRKYGEYTISSPELATSPGDHEDGILSVTPIKSSYAPGDVVTLTATPGEGYRFAGFAWGVDTGGGSADVTYEWIEGNTFTIPESDVWIRAVFYKIEPHTLTLVTSEHVTAYLTPQQETYLEGDEVTLTVVADEGYFCQIIDIPPCEKIGDGVYKFQMINADHTIIVNAKKEVSYHVSLVKTGEGTIEASQDDTTHIVTVTAEAGEGYQFAGWYNYNDSSNPVLLSEENPYSFLPDGELLVLAFFMPPLYTVNVATNIQNGTLEVSPSRSFYFADETITLIGHPDDGYAVDAYYYAPVSDLTNLTELTGNSFQMPEESVAVTVVFERVYAIGVTASSADGGTVSGGGNYKELDAATVTATPNDGYRFVNWTEGGNEVSTDAEYTFLVTGACNFVANFVAEHTIAITSDPSNGGSTTGSGTYDEGDSVTVTASPAVGFHFTGWTENGNVVSADTSYTFTVTGDRTLVVSTTT